MGNRASKTKASKATGTQPHVMTTEISLTDVNLENGNLNRDAAFSNTVKDNDIVVLQKHNGGYMAMLSTDANLNDQGVSFYNSGEYDKAETLFHKSIEMNKVNGNCDSLEYITALRSLAATYRATHRIDEAIDTYNELIPIQKAVLGPTHNDTLVCMTDLGILYRYKYDFENAAPLYAHCYASAIHLYGEDHPTTAIFRNNLANLLTDQKKFGEAENMYKQCIEASIIKNNGEKNSTTLQYINNLALLYMDQQRHKEAKKLFKKCIEIGTQVYGRNHPTVRQWQSYCKQIDGCVIS